MGNSFWVRHRITPVTTRYIRIRVAGMDERISKFYKAVLQPCMRFEVYGCAKPGTTEPPLATLPPIPTTRKNGSSIFCRSLVSVITQAISKEGTAMFNLLRSNLVSMHELILISGSYKQV